MRLSDLLDKEVLDERGESLGSVNDVRLVQDGPPQGDFGAALRVAGLIAGPGSVGSRLGFDQGLVPRPALLRALFTWLHRKRVFVPWERIAAIEEERIRIRGTRADLRHPREH